MTVDEDQLSFDEAAGWLGVSRSTLYRWLDLLPDFPRPHRPTGSRNWRFRLDELVEWKRTSEERRERREQGEVTDAEE